MSEKARSQKSGQNSGEDSTAPAKTVKIVRDYSQLTTEEQVELSDACGDVRDQVREIHNNAIGMARATERPNHMLNRAKLEGYLRKVETIAKDLRGSLDRIPFAVSCVALAACLMLSGCGSSHAPAPEPCKTCRAL